MGVVAVVVLLARLWGGCMGKGECMLCVKWRRLLLLVAVSHFGCLLVGEGRVVSYRYASTVLQLFIKVCLCASIPQHVLLTSCGFFAQ